MQQQTKKNMTSTVSRFYNRRKIQIKTVLINSLSESESRTMMNQDIALNKKSPSGLFSFIGKTASLSLLKSVVHFIYSMTAFLKKSFFEKADYGMKPVSIQAMQAGI